MSVESTNPLETRLKNLIQISYLTMVFGLIAIVLYIFLGITSQNWYNFLVAGSFALVTIVALLIVLQSRTERPVISAWYLLFSGGFTALVISAVQATAGAEIGSAVLVLILVLVIQTFPQKQVMLGALLGAITSVGCSVLAFYSPVPQTSDVTANLVITWIARGSTIVFLALGFRQFRSLNLASKLLFSFLGVVVLTSMTFNIILSTTTTNSLTNQIGEQLHTVADSRASVVGDYLAAQVEVLNTLALDETIRQSVRAANALKPDLESILALDEQWQQAVASGSDDPLIHSRLSSSLSNDLHAFQSISPNSIEVFVTDKQGALVATTGITSDYYQADEPWWQSAYQQEDAYISSPIFDESANTLSILMAVPIYDTRQGDLIGILRNTVAINGLISVIDDPIGETGETGILFPDATILDARKAKYEGIDPESLVSIQDSANQLFIRSFFEGKDSILAQTQVQSNSTVSKVTELGWTLIISQDAAEALAPVNAQLRVSSIFGTFMAGIASLLSLFVAQRLAKPIINLTETASEVAHGDLKARAEVNSQDEIGQLSETFNAMTAQLQETLVGLEERVAERTAELEKSSQQIQKRAGQFEAIAQLARTITSFQDPEILLPRITQMVSQQFGHYHVGLFLLDESRQYAVLSAANSEGGQRMLARGHRLGVGQTGIVGYVTATGDPRIALDTGTDTVYFDNPDLPETRSEMALPLRIGGSIIGALDVQSTESNAFSEEDVEVLSILADEVSVAIDNARLFAESQRVLANAQSAFQEYTSESWRKMVAKRKLVGYELSGVFIRPLEKPVKISDSTMSVPIKLRNEVIGSMNISLPAGSEWTQDEMEIAQALAERVGIASESAMLLEESQRRATKEHTIGQVSEKFIASTNISDILKTAVQEISQIISGAEVAVQLEEIAE